MNNINKFKKIKGRFVTLIEMMIVMFLIALITGVVAYNYRGSLNEGKAFKTKTGMHKLQTILEMMAADGVDIGSDNWKTAVQQSPLVHDADSLLKDGWGQYYQVEYNPQTQQVTVTSPSYNNYRQSSGKRSMFD